MARLHAFVRLCRPRFLVESVISTTIGLAVAVHTGRPFAFGLWLTVQAAVTLTHLMTQFSNEYFDLEADSAHTAPSRWTGGSQVLVTGELRPVQSLRAAQLLLVVDAVLAAAMPTWTDRLIAFGIIALAWFYTAPPIRLNYRGFGEVTTAGVISVLCPLLMTHALLGHVPGVLFALVVPHFLVLTARMTVMNFCDADSDLLVGKRTLPNLLGPRRAARLFGTLQVVAYAAIVVLTVLGALPIPAGVAIMATAPVAFLLGRRILAAPPSLDDPDAAMSTARAATLHVAAMGVAAVVGMIVATAVDLGFTASVAACAAVLVLYLALVAGTQLRDVVGARQPS